MGLIFDTEAKEPKLDRSWSEYREVAGVSTACTIDTETGLPAFYSDMDEEGTGHSIEEFALELEEADFIVGYNSLWYDLPVIAAHLGHPVNPRKHIDLYDRIRDSLNGARWERGSWKLDRVGRDTIGIGKTTSGGAFAPTLWKDHRIGELVTYLHRDVWVLYRLWQHVQNEGFVLTPHGDELYIDLG